MIFERTAEISSALEEWYLPEYIEESETGSDEGESLDWANALPYGISFTNKYLFRMSF